MTIQQLLYVHLAGQNWSPTPFFWDDRRILGSRKTQYNHHSSRREYLHPFNMFTAVHCSSRGLLHAQSLQCRGMLFCGRRVF